MGRLYLVPTPIGNLEDISLRALRILREVDWIACEDTRHTAKLLNHFDIRKKCVSYYKPKEALQAVKILEALKEGQRIALVSDAGSPALSDPGTFLVAEALKQGQEIEALPGATALIPALTASGFPTSPFVFWGFPPRKSALLGEMMKSLGTFTGCLVFYESPHRIVSLCRLLAEFLPDCPAVAYKEISKLYETRFHGSLLEIAAVLETGEIRGEWVLVVYKRDSRAEEEVILDSIEDIYALLQNRYGISKNRVRKIIQTRKN